MPRKILIVEDDSLLIEEMKTLFEKNDFEVISAIDGDSGFEAAHSQKPDIILLDIVVPKLNGVEVLRRLRESSDTKDIPVIVLTNMDNSTHMAQVLELGNYDYLVKTDWSLADLLAKVNQKLAGQSGGAVT